MENLAFLSKEVPGFAVKGANVNVMTEPSQFHNELCALAASAKQRTVLATLYVGTGFKEQTLLDNVKKSLQETNGEVKVKILLDYCRGTRDVKGKSSCTMLLPLVEQYKDSCKVSLYHTPNLRGVLKRTLPGKFSEIIGLQHTKVFVFDNDVCISGANLSNDYFTQRQDRYILIKDAPKLANYFEGLIDNIASFSFDLKQEVSDNPQKPDIVFNKSNCDGSHPYQGNLQTFVSIANKRIVSFLSRQKELNTLKFDVENDQFVEASPDKNKEGSTAELSRNESDTWVFPSIQMGPLGINQDQELTSNFLENSGKEKGSRIVFGTGYFNLTDEYMHAIMHKSKANFDILCAHPKANSFFNASFPLYGIPFAYTLIAKHFLGLCRNSGVSNRIQMFEYQRPDWTFHGKGMWYYPNSKSNYPIATLIGSPNFGYRSVERDLEAQLSIVTKNEKLQKALHNEQKRFFEPSAKVTQHTFSQPERIVPRWVKIIVGTCRKFF